MAFLCGLALHDRHHFLFLALLALAATLATILGHQRLVIAGDLHRPIGATAARIFRTRHADARCIMQQEVLAMRRRVDPLAERLLEIVIAIGDVFGGAARPRRRDARRERAERLMAE